MMRLLLVDDEPDVVDAMGLLLRSAFPDATIDSAGACGTARDLLDDTTYDAALVDYELPDGPGSRLLDWLRSNRPGVGRVLVSGHDDAPMANAQWVLHKPFEPSYLVEAVRLATAPPAATQGGVCADCGLALAPCCRPRHGRDHHHHATPAASAPSPSANAP